MRLFPLSTTVILLAIIQAPALAQAQAQERLNSDAIKSKLTGNTATLVTNELDLTTGYLEADGSMRGHIRGQKYTGSWEVKEGDLLCFNLPGRTFDSCRRVFQYSGFLQLHSTTGTPSGRIEILSGNYYSL